MSKLTIVIALFTLIMTSSCSDQEESSNQVSAFETITFSSNCGWCTEGEEIIITKELEVEYFKSFPCSPENNIKKERSLTEEEIQRLNEVFELEKILAIELDQCGQCYDGCDDTLSVIGTEGESQTIRYDKEFDEFAELQEIEPLIETILEIRNSF